ncbi:sialidase family protein [Elizabethkingia meningoseptica]|uniref:sialidase family protein n=1 Tax=Elizabethkingia meningoseptica TaxID=238 RepID=UPI0008420DD7|nr:sialidase family protein [Elizabethkingia meningoseptica]ODM50960.1 sialidase [Elizabethkingia meningoseptica]OHT26179.1 sialidase [Elizabethkingia meningoseptica]OPC06656.1 sialidase [Elizabethkingia meningoseptica]
MKHFLFLSVLLPVLGLAQNKQILFTSKQQNKVSCYRIPSLVTTPNGSLIAAADERIPSCADLNNNTDINIVIRISHDKGKTWSPAKRIIDFPEKESASDVSMVTDHITKEVFLFYNYMNLAVSKTQYRFQYIKSGDNGKTWSKPVDITNEIAPEEWRNDFKFITSGRGFQTKEGWILNTMVRLHDGVYVFGSKDHGKSWFRNSAVAEKADETNIVELPNGNWFLNARVQNLGFRKFYISENKGKDWTSYTEKQLEDPTCNASTLVYNNNIIFSNLHSPDKREKLGIKISRDLGKTWNTSKIIEKGSAGYSVMTPVSKNKIGLLYESDDYKDIVYTDLSIAK